MTSDRIHLDRISVYIRGISLEWHLEVAMALDCCENWPGQTVKGSPVGDEMGLSLGMENLTMPHRGT